MREREKERDKKERESEGEREGGSVGRWDRGMERERVGGR